MIFQRKNLKTSKGLFRETFCFFEVKSFVLLESLYRHQMSLSVLRLFRKNMNIHEASQRIYIELTSVFCRIFSTKRSENAPPKKHKSIKKNAQTNLFSIYKILKQTKNSIQH